jgi:hypothetical protein
MRRRGGVVEGGEGVLGDAGLTALGVAGDVVPDADGEDGAGHDGLRPVPRAAGCAAPGGAADGEGLGGGEDQGGQRRGAGGAGLVEAVGAVVMASV